MKNFKRMTALFCAFACVFSLTGLFTIATEEELLTPLAKTGLYIDRSEDTTYLCGVPCNSTKESVKNLLEGDCEVYSDDSIIKSGDTVKLFVNGIPTDEATVIVTGDVNEDGVINGKDLIRLKKYMNFDKDPILRRSCDINNDGSVNANDMSKLTSMISADIENVEFVGTPEKTTYLEGERFSAKGMYVNVEYTDGTVLSYADGFNLTYPSEKTYFEESDTQITVEYQSVKKQVSVNVDPVTSFEARITKNDSDLSLAYSGTNTLISDTALKSSQIWVFTKQTDGSFEIKNKDTGKCLASASTSVANGTNVAVASDDNSASQRWFISRNDDDTYTIKTKLGAFVLDITAGEIKSGSNIQLYKSNSTAAQKFEIELITDIENKIENSAVVDLGTDFIATVTNPSSYNNVGIASVSSSNAAMKTSEKTVRQLWRFAKQSDGSYMIINQENGKALDVSSASAAHGTNVGVSAQSATAVNQRWFILQDTAGYTLVPKCSSKCVLDIQASGASDNTNLQIGEYNGRISAQQFTITKFSGNFMDYTAPVDIGTHFNAAITMASSPTKEFSLNGTNVVLSSGDETSDQVWRFERQSNNTYKIINNSNGSVLDLAGANTAAGTNIQVSTDNGSNAQRWYLCPKEGNFIIRSALSKDAVIDIAGANTANGTNIDIYTPNLTPAQIFNIKTNEMTAMSFNVYCAKMTDDRMNRVITKIKTYMPDTFGVQEATPVWMNKLNSDLGGTYASVGLGRDGGNTGEHSSIFYNKHIFNLLGWGTKWLSDTPDTVSKYSESLYIRIFTYAFLQRKSDNAVILVINTHLDYSTDAVRLKQLAVIKNFIDQHGNNYPVYISGDYNADYGSAACLKLQEYGFTNGSAATVSQQGPTFTNFGADNRTLDYIYFSSNDFDLQYYKVCNEYINGSWTSDHHPVFVKYTLN